MSKQQSQIIDENVRDEKLEEDFLRNFRMLHLGLRVNCGVHLPWLQEPIKKIKKDNDVYHVSDAYFFKNEDNGNITHTHCFLIEKDGKFLPLSFEEKGNARQDIDSVNFIYKDKIIPLGKDADIHDVYNLRFHLRHNKEAKKLMDNFILVDDKSREHYRLYKIKQLYYETKVSLFQRKSSRGKSW